MLQDLGLVVHKFKHFWLARRYDLIRLLQPESNDCLSGLLIDPVDDAEFRGLGFLLFMTYDSRLFI